MAQECETRELRAGQEMDQPDRRQTGRVRDKHPCGTGAVFQHSEAGVPSGTLQQQKGPERSSEKDGLYGEGNHDWPGHQFPGGKQLHS